MMGLASHSGVVPAKARTHIPEAGGYGSPLSRGRQQRVAAVTAAQVRA